MQARGVRHLLNKKGDFETAVSIILVSMLCLLVIAAIYVMVKRVA